MFDSMLHESNIMDESTSPFIKARPFMTEHLSIFDYPDVPAGNKNHLSEERFCKISFSLQHNAHIISLWPTDLKIVPDSHTKITVEEEVISSFPCQQRTKSTINPIIHMPMPPIDHILSVKPVHNKHPSKHIYFHCA